MRDDVVVGSFGFFAKKAKVVRQWLRLRRRLRDEGGALDGVGGLVWCLSWWMTEADPLAVAQGICWLVGCALKDMVCSKDLPSAAAGKRRGGVDLCKEDSVRHCWFLELGWLMIGAACWCNGATQRGTYG